MRDSIHPEYFFCQLVAGLFRPEVRDRPFFPFLMMLVHIESYLGKPSAPPSRLSSGIQ